MPNALDFYRKKLLEYEKVVVSYFVQSGQRKSTTEKFAIIYAYFLTRHQLTQKQLQELTDFSMGTISQIVNQLLALEMLHVYNIPGTHEKRYEMVWNPVLVGSILIKLQNHVVNLQLFLKRTAADLERIKTKVVPLQEEPSGTTKMELEKYAISDKIERIQTFISDLSSSIPILQRIVELIKGELGTFAA
ncbi:MAG: hypothetical protein LUQ65_04270 [Candidatus Helarchaeota archaeon]|nr:hypothetical protein [Candidatus Helarchaeota archaeon]